MVSAMPRRKPARHPRVSVVIPVHNGERFVAASIRSALAQTRQVLECIVIDDGSTDGTIDVLRTFGRDITVVRQPPAGVAAARNAGMRVARGDHIAFLDADDVWLPHKVERQLRLLASAEDHGAVYSGYVIADDDLRPRRVVLHGAAERSVMAALLTEGPGLGFAFTGMTTRAAAQRVGRFDERLSTSADLDFAWRLSRTCRVVGVREVLAIYRQHGYGQMHLDIARLERDMAVVLDAAQAAGLPADVVRRGRANLQSYVAVRLLLEGAIATGLARLLATARRDPRRLVLLVAAAAARRVAQHVAVLGAAGSAGRAQVSTNQPGAVVPVPTGVPADALLAARSTAR
jgi:GT2 family glycosyltransferase